MSDSESTTQKRFVDYQLAEDVQDGIRNMGLQTPTPIQELCIPPILEGRDVAGKAETGTGKTIGFAAPLVGKLDTQRVATQALVLTPTRELAKQVAEVVEELGKGRNLGVAMVVGGVHASEQLMKLRSGSQIVVGTPGRVLDFLRERHLSLAWCETVVLDEADRMLDMGFVDDVTEILNKTPEERQTLLFSATIPPEVEKLLKRYMRDPLIVSTSKGRTAASEIRQQYVEAGPHRKFRELCKILDQYPDGPVIVFCNTRRRTIDVDRMLWGHGYSAGALHGDQEQEVRFKVLESFRQGQVKCLVCTDVASRGLDIDEVSCVVNYEIPDDEDSYVHRIGRTGRAQKTGVAISIVAPQERSNWQRILRTMDGKIERLGKARADEKGKEETGSRRGRGRSRRRERGAGGRSADSTAAKSASEATGSGKDGKDGAGGERAGRRRRGGRRRREDPVEAAVGSENGSSTPDTQGESSDDENPTLTYTSPRLAEKKAAKRRLMKLDEIDDDFVKTDYFEIDDSVISRAAPSKPPAASRGSRDAEGSKSRRSGGSGGRGGRGSRGRGRGGRGRGRRGGERPAEGQGGSGADASAQKGRAEDGGASEAGATEGGARKSRPRRRRRRRSASGSSASGSGGSGSGASGSPSGKTGDGESGGAPKDGQ